MSQVAQLIARCECQCRKVSFRTEWLYGNWALISNVNLSHSDVDCNSLSADTIQTPFSRTFPVRNADCTKADPVLVEFVGPTSLRLHHRGWQVEADGQVILRRVFGVMPPGGTAPLELDLNGELGGEVIVTCLMDLEPADPGGAVIQSCRSDLLFPEAIEVTLPASIDLSSFDADNSGGAWPLGCIIGRLGDLSNRVVRSADVFNRVGDAAVILTCVAATAVGQTAGATYRYLAPSGVCMEVSLSATWSASDPSASGMMRARATAAVRLHFIDKAVVMAPGEAAATIVSTAVGIATAYITTNVSIATVKSLLASQPEHQSPACGDGGSSGLLCATDDAYWLVSPLQIYAAGSLLDLLGFSEDWLHFDGLYLQHDGLLANCDPDEVSLDPFGPLLVPPGKTNSTISVQVDSVTPADNDPDACQCITGLADASGQPIELHTSAAFLGNGQSLDVEACECAMTDGSSHPVDCFPERIEITLPDSLDLSDYADSDCAPSSLQAGLASTYIGSGVLTRDSSLRKKLVLAGVCTSPIAGSAADFGAWSGLFQTSITFASLAQLYRPVDSGGWSFAALVRLVVGYIDQSKAAVEPDTLVRMFTACYVKMRVRSGTNEEWLELWAANPGPETDIAGLTAAEKAEFAQQGNRFGFQHNWEFASFALARHPTGHYDAGGPGTSGACTASMPSSPDVWYCPCSPVMDLWPVCQAKKESGADLFSELCPDCDSSYPAAYWASDCVSQHGPLWFWPDLLVRPTSAPVSSIDSDTERFVRYVAS